MWRGGHELLARGNQAGRLHGPDVHGGGGRERQVRREAERLRWPHGVGGSRLRSGRLGLQSRRHQGAGLGLDKGLRVNDYGG